MLLQNKILNFIYKMVKGFCKSPIYYIVLLAGMTIRIIPFILNRSLWLDEAKLSINIVGRSFIGLLQPLDYGQVAPILFLLIEKANLILFGNTEYSLRLFPLICGLLSLPLMYHFTKSITGSKLTALIALFLISSSVNLIYYSGEVKQYECDLFVTLCLLNLVFNHTWPSDDDKRYKLLAIAGSIFIFMSNIAGLVLFTMAVYYLFKYGIKFIFRQRIIIVMFSCWTISFALYYFFFFNGHPNLDYQVNAWQNDFMPLQIFSSQFITWIFSKFLSVFDFYTVRYAFIFLIAIVFFVIRKQWLFLYLLIFPMLLHFTISGFKLYPVFPRLILYLTAFITPMLAIAIYDIAVLIKKWLTIYVASLVVAGILSLMIIMLVENTYIWNEEEIKRSIDYINTNAWPDQPVYVYYGAQYATMYYEKINYIAFKDNIIWGKPHRRDAQNYLNDILSMNGEVWLLFSHVINYTYPAGGNPANSVHYYNEEDYIMRQLLASNQVYLLKVFQTTGSSAYMIKIVHQQSAKATY